MFTINLEDGREAPSKASLLNFNKNIYCYFKAIAPILLEDMRKVAVDKKGKMNKCIFFNVDL